jgi:hypothetical protein
MLGWMLGTWLLRRCVVVVVMVVLLGLLGLYLWGLLLRDLRELRWDRWSMECRRRSGDNWGRNRCQLGGWCWRNCNGLRWSNGLGGNLRGDRLRRLNWLGGLNGDWSNCSRWLNWLGCRGGGDGSSSGLDCRLRHCWRHHRLHAGGRSLGHSGFASGLPHERLCLHILGAGQSGFCNGGLDNCCHWLWLLFFLLLLRGRERKSGISLGLQMCRQGHIALAVKLWDDPGR